MKRLTVLVLGLLIAMTLTACAGNEGGIRQLINFGDEGIYSDTPAPVAGEKPETKPETKPEVKPQPETTTDTKQNQQKNYFFNENNNYYDLNAVSIRPRYMYWDNGVLVAECFVVNGLPVNVFNINVQNLELSNKTVKIAQGGFGVMQNAVIAPYSHVIWTFYFNTDCVLSPNADLTGFINCVSDTSYNY